MHPALTFNLTASQRAEVAVSMIQMLAAEAKVRQVANFGGDRKSEDYQKSVIPEPVELVKLPPVNEIAGKMAGVGHTIVGQMKHVMEKSVKFTQYGLASALLSTCLRRLNFDRITVFSRDEVSRSGEINSNAIPCRWFLATTPSMVIDESPVNSGWCIEIETLFPTGNLILVNSDNPLRLIFSLTAV